MKERIVFSTNMLAQLAIHIQRIKLNSFHTPYTKMNSNRIEDLNVITKRIKLLGENIDVKL